MLTINDVKVGDKVIAKTSSGLRDFPDAQKDYIKGRVYTVVGIKDNMLFTDNDNGWNVSMFDLVVEKPKVKEYEIGKKYVKDDPGYQTEKYAFTCVAYNKDEPIFQNTNGGYVGLKTFKLKQLIPLPEKKSGTVWVNIYSCNDRHWGGSQNTKELAKRYQKTNPIACIACIEVPWVEGQGL